MSSMTVTVEYLDGKREKKSTRYTGAKESDIPFIVGRFANMARRRAIITYRIIIEYIGGNL